MRSRRARLLMALKDDEVAPTVVAFPLLGASNEDLPRNGPVASSVLVPDEVINPHPRFGALTKNIRERRGSNVEVVAPLFQDENTTGTTIRADAMAFGMGCCCLQVTFQAREVAESRHLYDQLAVLAPIFLALTAGTPAARGVLLDTDSRWDIIGQSVDDRTPAERGEEARQQVDAEGREPAPKKSASSTYHPSMAAGGRAAHHKSRYASISLYICETLGGQHTECSASLNDVPAPYDDKMCARLREEGIDAMLARHVAHLFSRDPLVVFRGRVNEVDDHESTEHFENLQSTNWQTVRWKPPPASSKSLGGNADIGWRVEFRSMEVQLTDFENAAFTVFVVLVSRVILYFDLNLYQPLSKVDENMRRAQGRDALLNQKFWFCQSLMPDGGCPGEHAATGVGAASHAAAGGGGDGDGDGARKKPRDKLAALFRAGSMGMQEVTVLEILQGKGEYKGLVPMIFAYLEGIGTDSYTMRTVSTYLDFIVARAAGELMTPAAWMRHYVRSHPDYKYDSVISSRIAADLMAKCHRIGQGLEKVPELHGHFHIEPVLAKDAYSAMLVSNIPLHKSASSMGKAVERYAQRSELMARRRQLQADLEKQRQLTRNAEDELAAIEAELDLFNETHFS